MVVFPRVFSLQELVEGVVPLKTNRSTEGMTDASSARVTKEVEGDLPEYGIAKELGAPWEMVRKGLGYGVQSTGLRVQGFRMRGLRYRVSGYRVLGF
jgi:hypothetical protein